jgi:GDP-L-fucose synthase
VDDLADACVFLMERGYDGPLINIGTGTDLTIRELAETVMQVVGFQGASCTTTPSPTARRAS